MTRDEESLQLLQQHRKGDKSALKSLCELHKNFIMWSVNRIGGRLLNHDDAVNEAWLGFLEGVDRFDVSVGVNFMGFVGQRVRGRLINMLGSELELRSEPSGQTVDEETTGVSPEDLYMLQSALTTLSPRERDVIKARYFDDVTQTDIASTMGLSQQRVNQIEASALENLKEAFSG